METIPIKRSTVDAVVQYLFRCPYGDVERLIVLLRQDVQAAQQPPAPVKEGNE